MNKTTLYLPDELKRAVTRESQRRGVSEAAVIREAIAALVDSSGPRPRAGLFAGAEPIAERVDELLAGFGE